MPPYLHACFEQPSNPLLCHRVVVHKLTIVNSEDPWGTVIHSRFERCCVLLFPDILVFSLGLPFLTSFEGFSRSYSACAHALLEIFGYFTCNSGNQESWLKYTSSIFGALTATCYFHLTFTVIMNWKTGAWTATVLGYFHPMHIMVILNWRLWL